MNSILEKSTETEFFYQTWPAFLYLEFTAVNEPAVLRSGTADRATRLVQSRHKGPLYIQKPFYPQGKECAHVYLLHPPGGLCSGDDLQLSLVAGNNANVLITSPGATRIYKARSSGDNCRQADAPVQKIVNRLKANKSSCVEWLPMETIIYPSARAQLSMTVDLDESSCFTGWEILCLGLPASEQYFDSGRLQQNIQINIEGRVVLVDRFSLTGSDTMLSSLCGLSGQAVSAVMLAGPFPQKPDGLISELRQLTEPSDGISKISVTYINRFLVCRYLGGHSSAAKEIFTSFWKLIRPDLIKRSSTEPAIWRT